MSSPVKRSGIVPSAMHDHETLGSSAFAPPGPHLGRTECHEFLPRSDDKPGQLPGARRARFDPRFPLGESLPS
jgi:hypothetical protein